MAYSIIKFDIEPRAEGDIYVALVQKDGEEQPFRIALEHFETEKEAMEQVKVWIKTQEEDDARGIADLEEARKKDRKQSIISKLNKNL